MKKRNIVIIIAVLLVLLLTLFFVFGNTGAKDTELSKKIKEDANLDILVNLGNFSKDNYDESKLLNVAMQLADKVGLLNETSGDSYVQYVAESDLHLLINELTGITINAPIEIEDFYYLYDGENEYYFCRPVTPVFYSIKEIKSIKESSQDYEIVCSLSMIEDLEETIIDNVEISISYMPENSFIKYQVDEIKY